MDLVLKNAEVFTENQTFKADIGVLDEKIVAISTPGTLNQAKTIIDCSGKYVLPGVVDLHVHFNDPGYTHREDFLTGSYAAAAGGTTVFIDMPLANEPATINEAAAKEKITLAAEKSVIDYGFWGGLVTDNVKEMPAMDAAGVAGFKAFTVEAGDNFPYATNDILYKGMLTAAELGALIIAHCEDNSLVDYLENKAKREGNGDIKDFLASHPPFTELVASDLLLELAKETDARTHICHASLPEVVAKASQAKKLGARITVETCPHYLVFNEDDLPIKGAVLKCTPPVRAASQVERMWEYVFNGGIDAIGSDHSPSTVQEKNPESNSIWDAWGGINGVQTMLPVLFSEGVIKRGLPVQRLVELLSANPAKILGIYPKKGTIQVGADADFAILDPQAQWTITPDILFYKNKQTPYMNMECQGKVLYTILRGQVIYQYGEITTRPGYGKHIRK